MLVEADMVSLVSSSLGVCTAEHLPPSHTLPSILLIHQPSARPLSLQP